MKGDFYGFPLWFNEDGSVREGYYNSLIISMKQDINNLIMKDKKEAA